MSWHFEPRVEKFIAAWREARPECPARAIDWGHPFLTAALTLICAKTGRIEKRSGGLCRSTDLDSMPPRRVAFVAAGDRARWGAAKIGKARR